jgi:hypothetical protein
LQFLRYLNVIEVYRAHAAIRLKTSKHSTPSKSRSFYAILNASQAKACLLHGL